MTKFPYSSFLLMRSQQVSQLMTKLRRLKDVFSVTRSFTAQGKENVSE